MALTLNTNSAATKAAISKELKQINDKLEALLKTFDTRAKKAILRKGAKILQAAAQANIKDSKKPHFRYNTAKAVKGMRAPKGKGNIVAVYYPGNLRKSISILSFRRAKNAVFVGPKLSKGKYLRGESTDVLGYGKVDGYYAHWQEYGTVNDPTPRNYGYMRSAYRGTQFKVRARIQFEAKKKFKKYQAANKVA